MLVLLRYREQAVFDIHVEQVEYAAPVFGEHGSADFFIDRNSGAFKVGEDRKPLYIREQGGFYVEIYHPYGGIWRGIVESLDFGDKHGISASAVDLTKWLDLRHVHTRRVFEATSAATIVRYAVIDAVEGMGFSVLQPGVGTDAPPWIDRYEFSGQSCLSVLNDMMTRTGQEYVIIGNRVHWVSFSGHHHKMHLTEEGDLTGMERSTSADDQVAEIIGRNSLGQSTVVSVGNVPPWWAKQIVVNTR